MEVWGNKMVKIEHLSKKYNENIVLDDINFEIKKGDVVGIIGPSGTGKSTLLRCVNHLEIPESGIIHTQIIRRAG